MRRVQRRDRAAPALPQVGAVSLGAGSRPEARSGRPSALRRSVGLVLGLGGAGRFGRTGRWTMTEGTGGVCGLRASFCHWSCACACGAS